jgi:diguanylate cyclase (GGDEF)-like protein
MLAIFPAESAMTSDGELGPPVRIPRWIWLSAYPAYVLAAALGLALAYPGTNASPFWPPTALAIALLYRYGLRLWPLILAGAFTINFAFMLRAGVWFAPALPSSIAIGVGNMLEAWMAVYLLRRFVHDQLPFGSLRGLGFFVLFAAILAPVASATIGVTSSRWVDLRGSADYGENWLTWWIGDASGALTMAPALMMLLQTRWKRPTQARLVEGAALFIVLLLGTMAVFGIWPYHGERRYPLVFFLLPMILWAVLRFQTAGAVGAVFLISLLSVIGSLDGGGPFARPDVHESLLLLQLFITVLAGTTLGLGAVLTERSRMVTKLARSNFVLHELAFNDALTGLPNRLTLIDRLKQAERATRRNRTRAALLFLDLDRFKRINDSLGHAAGDELLKTMAARLRGAVREVDTVCRLGGDEFVILLADIKEVADAAVVARKVIEIVQMPVRVANLDLGVTTSIGIAMIPDDAINSGDVTRYADLAMYRAKERGRNNFLFYTEEMNQTAVVRLEREHELRRALSEQQFVLHYQPIVDLRSGQMVCVQALLRWQHPRLGQLLPREFIPTAEETGLIVDIGAWALEEACRDIRQLHETGQPVPRLALNLSLRQLRDDELPRRIARVLAEAPLDALWLNLEIAERLLHEDLISRLHQLRDTGRVGLSVTMDNFRSAGASLELLSRLPVTLITLERELVSRLFDDPAARDISLAVIAMAHNRELRVVAESVETRAQYDFLSMNGCDFAQGLWFHPTVPFAELPALLDAAPVTG